MIFQITVKGITIPIHLATREELINWINEAPNFSERQKRKNSCIHLLYSTDIKIWRQK